jgi:hypothetical protein
MRSVPLTMLILAGCQFQVAATPARASAADLALTGVIDTDPPAPANDLAASRPSADLAEPTTPIVASDMAKVEPDSQVGAACKTSMECGGGGLICVDQLGAGETKVQFPGGHCTRDCAKVACPGGSVCSKVGGFDVCLAQCPPARCRGGYRCCAADAVCAPDSSCS